MLEVIGNNNSSQRLKVDKISFTEQEIEKISSNLILIAFLEFLLDQS